MGRETARVSTSTSRRESSIEAPGKIILDTVRALYSIKINVYIRASSLTGSRRVLAYSPTPPEITTRGSGWKTKRKGSG